MNLPAQAAFTALQAGEALDAFAARYGRPSMLLLMHAAVPETLRPELLALLRANFLPQHQADAHLDADVLFGPLTADLGGGYYRVDPQVRWHALAMLRGLSHGEPRLRQRRVAELLWCWIEQTEPLAARRGDRALADYLDVQRWVALAYLDAPGAAAAFAQALKQATEGAQPLAAAARLRLGGLAAAVELPLAGHPELLAYARGVDALVQGDEQAARGWFEGLEGQALEIEGMQLRPARELLQRTAAAAAAAAAAPAVEHEIASPEALCRVLAALTAEARNSKGAPAPALPAKLGELEAHFASRWGGLGAVAEAFAAAWAMTPERDRSIAWFDAAVRASDGGASSTAAEQLAGLRIRRAWAMAMAARPDAPEIAQARHEIAVALDSLGHLIMVQPTVERQSLVGAGYRRLYLLEERAGDERAAARALAAAARAYAGAERLAAFRKPAELHHPALNRMACELIAGCWQGGGWKGFDKAATEAARRSLQAAAIDKPDFWVAVGLVELDLYTSLADRRLAPQQERLVQAWADLHRQAPSEWYWAAAVDLPLFVLKPYLAVARGADRQAARDLINALQDLSMAESAPAARRTCLLIQPSLTQTDPDTGGLFRPDHGWAVVQRAAGSLGLEPVLLPAGKVTGLPYAQILEAAVVVIDVSTAQAGPLLAVGAAMALRPTGAVLLCSQRLAFDTGACPVVHWGDDEDALAVAQRLAAALRPQLESGFAQRLSPVYAALPALLPPQRQPGRRQVPPDEPRCLALLPHGTRVLPDGRSLDMDAVYRTLRQTAERMEMECARFDDGEWSGGLDPTSVLWLLRSRTVVADVSTNDPRVLSALGVRQALRPDGTVVIAQQDTELPADLFGWLVLWYADARALREPLAIALARPPPGGPVYDAVPDLQPAALHDEHTTPAHRTLVDLSAPAEDTLRWQLQHETERFEQVIGGSRQAWRGVADLVARRQLDGPTLHAVRELLPLRLIRDPALQWLRLSLDEPVAGWPWELLLAPGNRPEAALRSVWRQTEDHAPSAQARNAVLLIAGLDAHEPQALADELQAAGLRVSLSQGEPLAAVRTQLQQYSSAIVVGLGTAAIGDFRHQGRRRYAWGLQLSDGSLLHAHHLAALSTAPALVVFESGGIGAGLNGLQPSASRDSAIALQLLADGVRAVVAPGFGVDAKLARRFTRSFFARLGKRDSVEVACAGARQDTCLAAPGDLTWASFQAWGDPELSGAAV